MTDADVRRERIDRGIKARTDDVFGVSSWREAAYLLAPRVLGAGLLVALALLAGPYHQRVLITASVIGLLAVSWDLLFVAGLISLGQALFFGVGAYLAGVLTRHAGLPVWASLPLSALGGGVICALLLAPVLRLRGIYFAMVTLVLPLIFVRLIEATRILGGTEGLSGLPGFPGSGVELVLALVLFVAVLFAARRILYSQYGLLIRAVKDDDRGVLAAGVSVFRVKLRALFCAATAGALAGAFTTHLYHYVGMPVFALDYSILPIAAAVVGGSGAMAGPAVGAFLLVPLSEALRSFGSLRIVVYGVLLVVFVVALPEGLFPFFRRKYQQRERTRAVSHG